MKPLTFLLTIFLAPLVVRAQNPVIDSLRNLVRTTVGPEQLDRKLDLAVELAGVNDHETKLISKSIYAASVKENDSIRIIRSGKILAGVFRRSGKTDSTLIIYDHIYPVAVESKNVNEQISILSLYGVAHVFRTSYDQALNFLFRALALAEKQQSIHNISLIENNIGLVYYKLKDYSKSIDYFKRCEKIAGARKNQSLRFQALLNISSAYAYLNNYNEARKYVEHVLTWRSSGDWTPFHETQLRFNQGLIAFGQEKWNEANKYFKSSLATARKINDDRFQLDNIDYLAQINIRQHQFHNALAILREADTIIDKGVDYNTEKIKIFRQYFLAYAKLNDFKNEARYRLKYIALKDSIYSEALTNNLMGIESAYLEKENLAKIEAHNEVLALREEAMQRQGWINVLSGVLIISLATVLITLFKSYKHKKSINKRLDAKVRERTIELLANRAALIRACEERDRLIRNAAHDLSRSVATLNDLRVAGAANVTKSGCEVFNDVTLLSLELEEAMLALKQRLPDIHTVNSVL